MRPSEALAKHRDEVLEILKRYPVSNPRVFGSVARGEDAEGSDLDILVQPSSDMSYFDLARLSQQLQAVLGVPVDLGEEDCLKAPARASILSDARPL
jgi:uncharacterized protein